MKMQDVIGQQEVKNRLLTMVAEGRVPHAMLFLGTEGSGALPLAYAFAQYMGCTGDKSNGDSCGTCPSCIKQQKFVHPDVHSIFPIAKFRENDDTDAYLPEWREMMRQQPYFSFAEWIGSISSKRAPSAASDDDNQEGDQQGESKSAKGEGKKANKQAIIAKDAALAIHQKLSMKPYEAERQILILWKPELMNATTSNSLLKILEEPPTDTMFILVSEDQTAILPTILSRTQVFKVPPIDEDSLTESIKLKHYLPQAEAKRIAHLAQGNYVTARRAIAEAEDMKQNLNFFTRVMRAAYQRDVLQLSLIAEDMKNLTRDQAKNTIAYFQRMVRESFVMNLGYPELNYLTSDEEQFLTRFAPFVHLNNVEDMARLIDKAAAELEQNGNIRMVALNMVLGMTSLIRNRKRPSAQPNA